MAKRLLNQYSIIVLSLIFVVALWFCGEFFVTAPLLIAATVYSLQLYFVRLIFVTTMKDEWQQLEQLEVEQNGKEEKHFSKRFFSFACWGAAIIFLVFSLLILLLVTSYVGYKNSTPIIQIIFCLLAILGAFLAYNYNAESIKSVMNLKQKFFSHQLGKWVTKIDRLGVAATVLVLVVTLHALGSMLRQGGDNWCFENEDTKQILGYITYLHSFAVMSGIFYVYTTHQILSRARNKRMNEEFPLISLGLLVFYGAVQTILIIAVHFPVYAHVYSTNNSMEDVPIGEMLSAMGPLILSVTGGIVAKLSDRRT